MGDYITFDSDFVEFGEGLVKSRALDDRVGCAVMLELMKLGKVSIVQEDTFEDIMITSNVA